MALFLEVCALTLSMCDRLERRPHRCWIHSRGIQWLATSSVLPWLDCGFPPPQINLRVSSTFELKVFAINTVITIPVPDQTASATALRRSDSALRAFA